mgnify:CR=1 FL=1
MFVFSFVQGIGCKERNALIQIDFYTVIIIIIIIQSELNGNNIMNAIGTLAVSVIEYSLGLVD